MQIRFIRLIDELFQGVPQTRETLEMKEEIVQNLMEKYNDLRAEGKSEEDAFTIAAASVGDINDIIGETSDPNPQPESPLLAGEQSVRQSPSATSWLQVILIFLVLVAVCPFAVSLFKDWRGPFIGVVILAGAFGLLIHQIVLSKKQRRASDEYIQYDEAHFSRDWNPTVENRKLFRSLNSALWTVAVAVYFLVSFLCDQWQWTWLIFLVTPVISNILCAALGLKPFHKVLYSALWLMTTVAYFIISFATDAWAISWIIFLIAASIQNVIKASLELKKGR